MKTTEQLKQVAIEAMDKFTGGGKWHIDTFGGDLSVSSLAVIVEVVSDAVRKDCEQSKQSPAPAGKLTDERLGTIGAEAAMLAMSAIRTSAYLSIHQTAAHCSEDLPARTAFARAVSEAVRAEDAALVQEKQSELATLRNERDAAVKDANTWERRYNEQTATLALTAKERDDARTELSKQAEEIARLAARVAELEWRPVSVRPTVNDADSLGYLYVHEKSGVQCRCFWHAVNTNHHTHWRSSPPPAPTTEETERAKFEAWWNTYGAEHQLPKAGAFKLWQVIHSSKEGQP